MRSFSPRRCSTISAETLAPFTVGRPTEIFSPSPTRRTCSNLRLAPGSPASRGTSRISSGVTFVWTPEMCTIAYMDDSTLFVAGLRPGACASFSGRSGVSRDRLAPDPGGRGVEQEAGFSIMGREAVSIAYWGPTSGAAARSRPQRPAPLRPQENPMSMRPFTLAAAALSLSALACASGGQNGGPAAADPPHAAASTSPAQPASITRGATPDDALCAPILIEPDLGFGTHVVLRRLPDA